MRISYYMLPKWVSEIDKVLQIHSQETLTCYGTRRCKTSVCENKENKVKCIQK